MTGPEAPPGRWTTAQRLSLAAACVAPLLSSVDVLAMAVALPAVQQGLDLDRSGLMWTVNGYALCYGLFVLVSGRVADLYGHRRTYLAGLGLFTLGSALAAVAPSGTTFLLARLVQGTGASFAVTSSLAVVASTFPSGSRARAVGWWGTCAGVGLGLGPVLGGWLVQAQSWRLIFALNLPFCVAGLILAARFVAGSRPDRAGQRLDVPGAVLLSAALACFTFALLEGPEWGWGSPSFLLVLSASALLMAGFVSVERRVRSPLANLGLFRIRTFSGAAVLAVLILGITYPFVVWFSLYFQQLRGYGALGAGLAFLPFTVAFFFSSRRAGAMTASRGPYVPLLTGSVLCVAAFAALLPLGSRTPLPAVLVVFALVGVGIPFVWTPVGAVALAAAPATESGAAAGLNLTCRLLGGNAGLAVAGVLASTQTGLLAEVRVVVGFLLLLSVGCLLVVLLVIRPVRPSTQALARGVPVTGAH